MNTDRLRKILSAHLPDATINKVLSDLKGHESSILTIVANKGVHYIDETQLKGSLCVASEGQMDLSSLPALLQEYRQALIKVAAILKGQHWEEIYLLPSGPTTLSMQIKVLVRQVTGKDTIDLYTDRITGDVWEIDVNIREIAASA